MACRLRAPYFILIAFGLVNSAFATEASTAAPAHKSAIVFTNEPEPYSTGWVTALDNDGLLFSSTDRDYTGGFSVTLGGSRVADYRLSLDPALTWINKLLHWNGAQQDAQPNHQMQFGLMLFTPQTDSAGDTRPGDRPFANLLFLENSQFLISDSGDRAYQSAITVGILGSNAGEAIQNAVHRVGDFSGRGDYGNQISAGGELTARYTVSRQSLLLSVFTSPGSAFELKYGVEGDIGYLTEGSATIAARWGRVESPWWSFAPTRSNYLARPVLYSRQKSRRSAGREFFVWTAITARARVYNAFLQGQFRDSEVSFSSRDLNNILGELSFGLTRRFANNINASLTVHFQTKEIRHGTGSRDIRWGGLTITRSF